MVKDLEQQQAEFSRPVAVDRVGDTELVEEIAASEAERTALAERFGWLSMDRLTATVRLRRLKPGLIRVSGRYAAELEQPCVVTLAPVPAHVEGAFSELYGEGGAEDGDAAGIAPTEEEPPEPIVAGRIDIGEAVVQQLAVTLDPYPRAPDASLPEGLTDSARDGGAAGRNGNPFAVLERLKQAKTGGKD